MSPKTLARIFPLGPDSRRQPGVPEGRLEKYQFNTSRIFPGTERDYWVYVPAQYRPTKAACLLVVQDGWSHLFFNRWAVNIVLDNLIHQGAMPIMIGVFINPGQVPPARPNVWARINRSFEYDSTGDRYVRFLLEELLPEVEQRYRIRADGNSRAIMGGSSGAFCALNAAWERPDKFQRVFSNVGSFAPMRGGDTLANRVRLTDPKPLRIFLAGGAADLDVVCGHWWTVNLAMQAALRYAGYEVRHAWDDRAGHNEFHGSMVCPAALRWLWSGYPRKVKAGRDSRQPVVKVLAPQRHWESMAAAPAGVGALAVDLAGRLCFAAEADGTIRRLESTGRTTVLARNLPGIAALAFDAAGVLLAARPSARQVCRLRGRNRPEILAKGMAVHGIGVNGTGGIYLAETKRNRVWHLSRSGGRCEVAWRGKAPTVLCATGDGTQMLVALANGDHVWITSIAPEGGLTHAEPFFVLCRDEGEPAREVTAMSVACPGWLLIATRAGLQLNFHHGLVAGFVPPPVPGAALTGVALAGPKRDELYVSCRGRIFRRRIRRLENLWF
ncbi:MAG: alpha/beta hydrolase-fold protein [Opitutales bacterium]